MIGRVFKIFSDFYYVETEKGTVEAKLRTVLKKQKENVFTGDYVELEQFDENSMQAFIQKVVNRKNLISRPKVANISQVVIVSALKEPDLNFEQLNRYIAHCEYHNIQPVLCFNKEDINSDELLVEKVKNVFADTGYQIIFTSALKRSGLEQLKDVLKHNTSIFCGASGVGKSSLINAILNVNKFRTLAVSEKLKRGVHTTRHCELINLENDSLIVDTPGFSHLKFDFLLPLQIENLFIEFKNKQFDCKYRNCLHIGEDGCGAEIIIKNMPPERYDSYKKFVSEAKMYETMISKKSIKQEANKKFDQNKIMTKISSKKRVLNRKTENQKFKKEEI